MLSSLVYQECVIGKVKKRDDCKDNHLGYRIFYALLSFLTNHNIHFLILQIIVLWVLWLANYSIIPKP